MSKYHPTDVIVLTNGFVFAGNLVINREEQSLRIDNPRNIRVWGTAGKGMGWLAVNGPTSETILDVCTTVHAPLSQLVFSMDVKSGPWE